MADAPPKYSEEFLQKRAELIRKAIREKIGKGKPMHPYEVEAIAYNDLRFGSPLRPIFLLGMMKLQWGHDPLIFSVEHEGEKNEWAYRQIHRFCCEKFPVFMGCGSSGKSYIPSACAYTAWKAKPWATSVFFSTTSGEAAEQRGWGYMKNFFRNDRCPIGAVLLEYKKSIVLEENVKADDKSDRDFRNSIHLVMIKPGNEGDNALAAISGRKNENVIWIKDESQLMTNDTTLAEANLCTNPFCQIIDLGNAPKEGTQFYETAKPYGPGYEDGYRSIDTNTATGWPTRSGYCEWFDGEKSPNLRYEGKPPFRGIISRDSIAEIERRSGGRDTPGFWVQVKGFPHSAEVADTVLTQDVIKLNLANTKAIWKGSPVKVLGGGDLGFRKDGDPCMAAFGKLGVCSDGVKRLEIEPHAVLIAPSKDSRLSFEDQIALRFIEECDRRGCTEFELDISGDGGKIYGSCLKLSGGRINFIPTSFMGSPDDVPIGNGDTRLCSEVYGKKVTQLWMNMRSAVIAGVIRGMSLQSAMTEQFCARKVIEQNSGKKQDVEKKDEMKKRIKRSPDDADSCVLLVNNARRHGLSDSLGVVTGGDKWDDDEEDRKVIPYQQGFTVVKAYQGRSGVGYSAR
jgi:hypothetical protein